MKIRQMDTSRRRDVQAFVNLPFRLYRASPHWVPPLLSDMKRTLDPGRHPFYRHSAAGFFLAEQAGQTVGRIAAMDHRPHNEHLGTSTAFFGLFDAVDDIDVARGLFDAASDWARARGLDSIVGPKHVGSAEPAGILVKGFEHRPAMGMAYNYPYYDTIVRASGFEKESDNLSGYLSGDYDLPDRFYRLAQVVQQRRGLWVKTFETREEMRQWVPRVAHVYQTAFAEFADSAPPTDDEIESFSNTLITIADPRLPKLVMLGDDVIGFLFAYHDISASLQRARGRLFPFGWYHLLTGRRRTDWVNINGMGVLPTYQGRGAVILLYTEVAKTIKSFGFKHADIVAVGEDNVKSRTDMETIGVQWYKRHRTYHRML
jgi:GNAT superfamily N-acetyltransferase